MNKIIDYIKHNYLFVLLALLIIVLFVVFVVVRLKSRVDYSWSPIQGEVAYEIKHHEANEYKIITVEDQDIALQYYKNWIYLVVNKPEEAYGMLSKESLKEFDTYEKFKTWVDRYKTVNTKDNVLTGYSYKTGGHNEFIVQSSERMRYRFNEYSVWNYKVEILGQARPSTTTTTKVTTTAKK